MLNNTPTCIIWETDFITHKLNICPDGDQGPDDIQAGFKEAPSQQEDEEAIAVVKGSVQQTLNSLLTARFTQLQAWTSDQHLSGCSGGRYPLTSLPFSLPCS